MTVAAIIGRSSRITAFGMNDFTDKLAGITGPVFTVTQ
jgi:hypothetical protein